MSVSRLVVFFAAVGWSQVQLPDGPGRAEMDKLCKTCHELARSVSKQQDRDGWMATMAKMTAFGMKGSRGRAQGDRRLSDDELWRRRRAADQGE
jgi:hypothetical protein